MALALMNFVPSCIAPCAFQIRYAASACLLFLSLIMSASAKLTLPLMSSTLLILFVFVLPNGNCTYCSILNCLQCLNSTFCALCASNYNLTAVGTCYSCSILNCTACSADGTSCIDCFPGYLPQTNTGFCVICNISGCTEC